MIARRKMSLILSALVAAAFAGCEADDSVPNAPRVQLLNADDKALDNAGKRAIEKPEREVPTGTGAEFPGQSNAGSHDVILAFGGIMKGEPSSAPASAPTAIPLATAATWGTLPHLHTLSKDHYAQGVTIVPGIAYAADYSWGQVLPLKEAPHRNWPVTHTDFGDGTADHNPTYIKSLAAQYPNLLFFAIPDTNGYGSGTSEGPVSSLPIVVSPKPRKVFPSNDKLGAFNLTTGSTPASASPQYSGLATAKLDEWGVGNLGFSQLGFSDTGLPSTTNLIANFGNELVLETPWFVIQTLVLPIMMIKQVPWAHVQSSALITDPVFRGYLPDAGPPVPTAYPGEIRWRYPWTGVSTTKPSGPPSTMPEFTEDMIPKERP